MIKLSDPNHPFHMRHMDQDQLKARMSELDRTLSGLEGIRSRLTGEEEEEYRRVWNRTRQERSSIADRIESRERNIRRNLIADRILKMAAEAAMNKFL